MLQQGGALPLFLSLSSSAVLCVQPAGPPCRISCTQYPLPRRQRQQKQEQQQLQDHQRRQEQQDQHGKTQQQLQLVAAAVAAAAAAAAAPPRVLVPAPLGDDPMAVLMQRHPQLPKHQQQ
ncbi:hypothetical protein Emag_004848 [Eimeria magna]